MRLAPRPYTHLAVVAVVLGLSGCIPVLLPAEQESTRYDSLPTVQPGVTSTELESRYGPAELRCADDTLWVYGWSVGHGAWVAAPAALGWGRLYYSLHVAFLWFDAGQRLVRIDVPDGTSTDFGSVDKQICTADGTCIRPSWRQSKVTADDSWACKGELNLCATYGLTSQSVVESSGKALACKATYYTSPPSGSSGDTPH